MKQCLEELNDLMKENIKKITKKGEINASDLDYLYKMTDIVKDIGEIKGENGQKTNGGYSERYPYMSPYMSYDNSYDYGRGNSNDGRRGRDGDSDGRYSEDGGNSYRRGRDARGRYTSRDGGSYDGSSYDGRSYSRHSEKERMMDKLESMMSEATSEQDRMALKRCMETLDN